MSNLTVTKDNVAVKKVILQLEDGSVVECDKAVVLWHEEEDMNMRSCGLTGKESASTVLAFGGAVVDDLGLMDMDSDEFVDIFLDEVDEDV